MSEHFPDDIFKRFEEARALRAQCYRGRFAPSPTGAMHLGNFRTALISWLRARLSKGIWLLRIDDLDKARNRLGAVESLQSELRWLGLDWDGKVVFQSQRRALYKGVLSFLKREGKLYPCRCTRRVIAKTFDSEFPSFIYPGTCRDLGLSWRRKSGRLPSWRLRVSQNFMMSCGDVILRRSDGIIAYHLATAVDDLILGITEVVRGEDLARSLTSQLAVLDALSQRPLSYRYVPLLCNSQGEKLSKRDGSEGLDLFRAKGMNSQKVIGLLAASLNLVPKGSELSAIELLDDLHKRRGTIESVLKL